MNCYNKGCENKAVWSVEKNDLSHREAKYCNEHAKPFKEYPDDFELKQLREAVR